MLLTGFLIPAPWYLCQILIHGQNFADAHFMYHVFSRVSTVMESHSGTIFFYIKYVFEHFFTPWLCLSLVVLLGFGPALYRRFKENKADPIYFLLMWFLIPFLFFSLSKTKVAGYIAPCYFPLAIITAKLSLDHLQRPWFKKIFFLCLAATAAEIILFHPLKMIVIDKSPEVKQLAEAVRSDHRKLITFNIPPNAPTFYFNAKVLPAGNATQLDEVLSQSKDSLLLCKKQDVQKIAVCIQKHHLKIIAISRNGKLLLMGAS